MYLNNELLCNKYRSRFIQCYVMACNDFYLLHINTFTNVEQKMIVYFK